MTNLLTNLVLSTLVQTNVADGLLTNTNRVAKTGIIWNVMPYSMIVTSKLEFDHRAIRKWCAEHGGHCFTNDPGVTLNSQPPLYPVKCKHCGQTGALREPAPSPTSGLR